MGGRQHWAVTAAWSIGKATQEAPNGLIGVAPTTEGGNDGKITGVDATMEYRAESETIYTACTGIEIEKLPAGNYFVRYAEDHNHFASPDAEVTVVRVRRLRIVRSPSTQAAAAAAWIP